MDWRVLYAFGICALKLNELDALASVANKSLAERSRIPELLYLRAAYQAAKRSYEEAISMAIAASDMAPCWTEPIKLALTVAQLTGLDTDLSRVRLRLCAIQELLGALIDKRANG